jgi:hypothetical protein
MSPDKKLFIEEDGGIAEAVGKSMDFRGAAGQRPGRPGQPGNSENRIVKDCCIRATTRDFP